MKILSPSVILVALVGLTGCSPSIRTYRIGSDSMSPAIRSGDFLVVDQSQQARTSLHDGDIITFKREHDVVVLKRILAMPGETISGNDHKIFRNGKQVLEPYLAPPGAEEEWMPSFPSHTVPPGELFVLGDNRDHSLDSRAAEYAPVTFADVVGKYSWTYWRAPKKTASAE